MDRISLLPDDVVFKILSFVPTKVVVSTNLLSKRWRYLWKHVPKLDYRDPSLVDTEHWRASRFVDKFLLLHEAPVLETLHLSLSRNCPPSDIETWISVAISRRVRNLHIYRYIPSTGPIRLPRSLYTCETLVSLYLLLDFTVDDAPFMFCLRSLKVLVLLFAKFSSDEIVNRLLSGCPVLEGLILIRRNDNVKNFTIAAPSLQRLIAIDCRSQVPGDDVGFVIKAPSLKSLTLLNFSPHSGFRSLVKMPDLVKASIKVRHGDSKMFMGCLTSTKRLALCLQPPLDSCPIGVFNQLVSLSLCTCSLGWCRLILNHTPKLRVLRFEQRQAKFYQLLDPLKRCCSSSVDVQTQWEQPSSVPKCLISSLETVEWIDYKGREVEKKVVMYLLENSRQLKTMAIRSLKSTNDNEKLKMLQELSSIHRICTKCGLSFT